MYTIIQSQKLNANILFFKIYEILIPKHKDSKSIIIINSLCRLTVICSFGFNCPCTDGYYDFPKVFQKQYLLALTKIVQIFNPIPIIKSFLKSIVCL